MNDEINIAGFSEEVVAILSLLSSLAGSLIKCFTWKLWHMYLSAVVGMLGGVAAPMIRSILSKSVPAKDTGKKSLSDFTSHEYYRPRTFLIYDFTNIFKYPQVKYSP